MASLARLLRLRNCIFLANLLAFSSGAFAQSANSVTQPKTGEAGAPLRFEVEGHPINLLRLLPFLQSTP